MNLIVSMGLFLASCTPRIAEIEPSNEYSKKFLPLRPDTLNGLVEINTWELMSEGDDINIIRYNSSLNRITAVSDLGNEVVMLSIEREESIFHKMEDIPDLQVLGIDENGNTLLVGMPGFTRNEVGKPRNYFHWIASWDPTSDSLIRCYSGSCAIELTDPDHIGSADIGAVWDSTIVILYNEYSYRYSWLSPTNGGGISLVNSPDSDYWWHIGMIAIDSAQDKLAIIFQEARIVITNIEEKNRFPLVGFRVLEHGDEDQLQPISNAIFSRSGKWLSVLRGNSISVWNVGGWRGKKIFSDQTMHVRGVEFNPQGDLLFIMIDDHTEILALDEKEVIAVIQTPGITSIDISDDNRLLFWGDRSGAVHMLGIPSQ